MDDQIYDILINGGLAMLFLEAIKYLVRFIKKDSAYNFPTIFYGVGIPVLNVLLIPALALLGIPGVAMPTDWLGWVRTAVLVAVSSLVSLLFYSGGYKKLKEYNEMTKQLKEQG